MAGNVLKPSEGILEVTGVLYGQRLRDINGLRYQPVIAQSGLHRDVGRAVQTVGYQLGRDRLAAYIRAHHIQSALEPDNLPRPLQLTHLLVLPRDVREEIAQHAVAYWNIL